MLVSLFYGQICRLLTEFIFISFPLEFIEGGFDILLLFAKKNLPDVRKTFTFAKLSIRNRVERDGAVVQWIE